MAGARGRTPDSGSGEILALAALDWLVSTARSGRDGLVWGTTATANPSDHRSVPVLLTVQGQSTVDRAMAACVGIGLADSDLDPDDLEATMRTVRRLLAADEAEPLSKRTPRARTVPVPTQPQPRTDPAARQTSVPKAAFTAPQFRASILKLADMVRDQNAIDGGTRMTSVILMGVTFTAYGTSTADQWWPTDARDGGHVDILEADLYALPHNTQTTCCPAGYTDGVKWRKAPQVIDPLRKFAQAHGTPWAISELGYLEDIHQPQRKATALSEAVAYARSHGAHHVEYFDSSGPRASWKLWHSFPVGTTSKTSNSAVMWKSLVSNN